MTVILAHQSLGADCCGCNIALECGDARSDLICKKVWGPDARCLAGGSSFENRGMTHAESSELVPEPDCPVR